MTAADRALARLGALDVTTDADVLEAHRRDQAAVGLLEPGMPTALIRPRSTADVRRVLRAACSSATCWPRSSARRTA